MSSPPPPSYLFPPRSATDKLFSKSTTRWDEVTNDVESRQNISLENEDSYHYEQDYAQELPAEENRISMYVRLFDEMISTVIESESYLFTQHELWILRYILELPYEPHYLLTRLLLRRPGKIHSLTTLVASYSGEVGEEGVKRAVRALCAPLDIPKDLMESEHILPVLSKTIEATREPFASAADLKPWANISTGLSEAEERADPGLAEAIRESLWPKHSGLSENHASSDAHGTKCPSPILSCAGHEDFSLAPKPVTPITFLANNETKLDLDAIMSCVSADDLKKVARTRKISPSLLSNRESTTAALLDIAQRQTTLTFVAVKGQTNKKTERRPYIPHTTSMRLLLDQLLPCLGGHVIQLQPPLHILVARVNLVFSRTPPASTNMSSIMLPPILVSSQRRQYPNYGPPTRSTIWLNRDELLTWERAVTWEALVTDALGDNWADQRKGLLSAFDTNKEQLSRVEGAKVVRRVWEGVWPIWKDLVKGERGKAIAVEHERGGLVGDRFQTGHVLTRIVYKGAMALGILHEYDLECMVLRALLAQRRWRRGKRGAWYERLALVLMNHYHSNEAEKIEKMEEATQTCIDGLLDEDTHLIYRPALSRRLTRLENKLNLPADERHISNAELLECQKRDLVASRVRQNLGQPRNRPREVIARDREASLGLNEGRNSTHEGIHQVGKSVWLGREGEVTVEGWVLEWWEAKGYKGYHAESSIITTLFALLMWPVLFHPLPGAFETVYQTAPLDLGEDTFARARHDMIESRLEAMMSTDAALAMLREADERERERGTWAVGLSWEFGREELREILTCVGGQAVSGICRMLSEEYRHRVSGVPDLIVWNYETREARFIEVKGPGDSLSETQKIWIDVLLSAGVPVEVCRVRSSDASATVVDKLKRKSGPLKTKTLRRAAFSMVDDSTEVDSLDLTQFDSDDEGTSEGCWQQEGKRTRR